MRLAVPLLLLCLVGCGEIRYINPSVDYGDQEAYEPVGNPAVDLGFYVEQLYNPLDTGEPCPIVFGLQGGTWTMPAVRMQGIAPAARVTCALTTDLGEQVGWVDQDTRFVQATDGWLEIQALPIPVHHPPPDEAEPINDLYGLPGTLDCTVRDSADRGASHAVAVELAEG